MRRGDEAINSLQYLIQYPALPPQPQVTDTRNDTVVATATATQNDGNPTLFYVATLIAMIVAVIVLRYIPRKNNGDTVAISNELVATPDDVPTRTRIHDLIQKGMSSTDEISKIVGKDRRTVQFHIKNLRESGEL